MRQDAIPDHAQTDTAVHGGKDRRRASRRDTGAARPASVPIREQGGGETDQRIGAVPQRLARRPPSAIVMMTTISSERGASDTVTVSKCSNDHGSSLWPSGTSSGVPGD